MTARFHSPAGRHDLGDADLDWAIFREIAERITQAHALKLTPGRHRPVRVNARLRRARLRAEGRTT